MAIYRTVCVDGVTTRYAATETYPARAPPARSMGHLPPGHLPPPEITIVDICPALTLNLNRNTITLSSLLNNLTPTSRLKQ